MKHVTMAEIAVIKLAFFEQHVKDGVLLNNSSMLGL